jgi:hypothetical protein
MCDCTNGEVWVQVEMELIQASLTHLPWRGDPLAVRIQLSFSC